MPDLAGEQRKSLKKLILDDDLLLIPGCHDVLSARIIEDLGFKALNLGGFAVGVTTGYAEHLLTLTEMVQAAAHITKNVRLPLIVDANGGFGSALHVQRTVREFEQAGCAGIYLEDQAYPKTAHYFKGEKEMITTAEMVAKIEAALEARSDHNFLIIARTDAYQAVNGGIEEAVLRSNRYLEAGAEVILPLPGGARNLQDAARLAEEIKGPAIFSQPEWKHWCEDDYLEATAETVKELGFKIMSFPLTTIFAAAEAVREVYAPLMSSGATGLDRTRAREARGLVERLKKVDEHCAIEKKYTNRA